MKVIVDYVLSDKDNQVMGVVFIDPDLPVTYSHPAFTDHNPTLLEVIEHWRDNEHELDQAGWNTPRQHPNETEEMTAWERLKRHSLSPLGHPKLKEIFTYERHDESAQSSDAGSSDANQRRDEQDSSSGGADNSGETSRD
jgi:hypothetical protein